MHGTIEPKLQTYNPWTDGDLATLRDLWEANTPIPQIAELLGRTEDAIIARRKKLGFQIRPTGRRNEWSEQEDATLRTLWAAGHSASVIADRLCAFKPGTTRNAVIGRAHRLDLPPRDVAERKHTPRALKTSIDGRKKNRVRQAVDHNRIAVLRLRRAVIAKPVPPPPELPPNGGKTILELGYHDCRYPYGDPAHPDFRYCGAHCEIEGSSWCNSHKAVVFTVAERKPSHAWWR